jgi:hypothetical protein
MPDNIVFDFDPKNRILRCRLHGRVTDEVLKECYRAMAEHAQQLQPHGAVLDLSAVTMFDVSPQTTRQLAHSEPAVPNPGRPRVVLAPADHVYGMARLFQMEGSDTRPNMHAVRTLQETWAILGVQDPQFEPLQAL